MVVTSEINIASQMLTYKDGFGIKWPTKVDMPWQKEMFIVRIIRI